jgi:hypothetical protein
MSFFIIGLALYDSIGLRGEQERKVLSSVGDVFGVSIADSEL